MAERIEGFFRAQPLWIAEGRLGFEHFGPAHLVWLAFSLALVVACSRRYARLPSGLAWGSPRRKALLACACVPVALLASQDAIMAASGVFSVEYWPLYSCNLCELLLVVCALWPSDFLNEVLWCLGVVGAAAALLFPSWDLCPAWSWPSLCGFVEHSLIIAFTTMQLAGHDFSPRLSHVWQPMLVTAVYLALIWPFDRATDSNFMFVNHPPYDTPLMDLYDLVGSPGYVLVAAAALVAVWLLMYLLWDRLLRRGRRSEGTGAQAR